MAFPNMLSRFWGINFEETKNKLTEKSINSKTLMRLS